MCDTIGDGQIGHDFPSAVGKVAEVDSTQSPGPGSIELRVRRVELHSLRPRDPTGIAVDDHSGVAPPPVRSPNATRVPNLTGQYN
jgi:hypothetical protein